MSPRAGREEGEQGVTKDDNGRIKLSWKEAGTIVGVLLALAAAWYDMRSQIAGVRAEVAGMRTELAFRVERADQDHAGYDTRLDRLESRRRP